MEQNLTLTTPISTPDQAMFDRVWGRVMASDPPSDTPTPLPVPTAPAPDTVSKRSSCEQLPCLGAGSAQYAALLRDMLSGTHKLWQSYQTLCRQTQGMAARQLRTLAEEQMGQLRRLNAVYFLLTGQRYLSAPMVSPAKQSLLLTLRELFMEEQHWRQRFLQESQTVHDPCLQQLFQELTLQAQHRMDAIRSLLERL